MKRTKTSIIFAGLDRYQWVEAVMDGKPIKIAWDEDGQYIHVESWNAFLPVPVDGAVKLGKRFETVIRVLRENWRVEA